jgi:acetoin utilization deacetylase AcuC-like enzyme
MTTLLYHHPVCAEHDMGYGHPECPERLEAILGALGKPEFAGLEWREAPAATQEQLTRVHPAQYVERVLAAVPQTGLRALDADTALSPRSGEAALRAAGAFCAAVDAVMRGEAHNAFCAVRPPGHHAEPSRAMGFCVFNNVAVGALHARAVHGLERVAVIDFDVHHGNGTQAAFWSRPECLYISTHQSPLYPGTGRRDERGMGNIINVPLAPYSGSAELREAWTTLIDPELRAFRPDFLLLSAGFDAHRMDPLAQLDFSEEDYAWLTREIVDIAADCCQGRIVSGLEGGYDLTALAASAAVHVKGLLEAATV